MSKPRIIRPYTVYVITSPTGDRKVYLTTKPVSSLNENLTEHKVEILLETHIKKLANKAYRNAKIDLKLSSTELESKNRTRDFMKELGITYGPENGKKVGRFAVESGHLARLRDTKVTCPDGHVSNLVFYKIYCESHELDPKNAVVMSS